MRSVLISINPKWCELIANGKKTVEVRKTRPKIETPFKVYIYCTKSGYKSIFQNKPYLTHNRQVCNGKVICEFVCNEITVAELGNYYVLPKSKTLVDALELLEYADEKPVYGWHISDLVIYDKPKELIEFSKYGFSHPVWIKRPPQSWCYVESEVRNNGKV